MNHHRRTFALALLFVFTVGMAATAAADPLTRPPAPHPRDERVMALDAAHDRQVAAWYDFASFQRATAWAAAVEQARYDAAEQARVAAAVDHYTDDAVHDDDFAQWETEVGNGSCGGDLPPCYVMERESGGSLTAENPNSTASGKWQFVDGTWNGYGGYSHASDAPEWVQDARAREVWAGGAGCANWSAC